MTAGEWVLAIVAVLELGVIYGVIDRGVTELGRIATVAEAEDRRRADLDERLDRFGR